MQRANADAVREFMGVIVIRASILYYFRRIGMWDRSRCAADRCDTGREIGPVVFETTKAVCFAVLNT